MRRLDSFGAFVELAPGVEGLVHQRAGPRPAPQPLRGRCSRSGQQLDVQVKGLDPVKKRISLSMLEEHEAPDLVADVRKHLAER